MSDARRCQSPSCGSIDVIVGRAVWNGYRECCCRVCWTEWKEECEFGIAEFARACGARNAERIAEAVVEAGSAGVRLGDLAQGLFFQRRTVRRHARRLADAGRIVIESDGRGAWMLRPVAVAMEAT